MGLLKIQLLHSDNEPQTVIEFLRAWLARVKWRDFKAAAALKLEIEARGV